MTMRSNVSEPRRAGQHGASAWIDWCGPMCITQPYGRPRNRYGRSATGPDFFQPRRPRPQFSVIVMLKIGSHERLVM